MAFSWFVSFDKLQRVSHAAIVENKRLGEILAWIKEQQDRQPGLNTVPKGPRRSSQASRAHLVRSLFVLLHLLKRYAQHLSEHLLGYTEREPALAHPSADMGVHPRMSLRAVSAWQNAPSANLSPHQKFPFPARVETGSMTGWWLSSLSLRKPRDSRETPTRSRMRPRLYFEAFAILFFLGIGLDTTSSFTSQIATSNIVNSSVSTSTSYLWLPGIGLHFVAALEQAATGLVLSRQW
jgi:hypothetical protein